MNTMKNIARELREASKAYYNTSQTNMSDTEFDALREKLRELDPDHPFLKEVGAPVAEHLEKVPHNIPMGSLNNAANEAEYRTWHSKHNEQVVVMHKLDGSSIEIIYRNGVLVQAISRGDSLHGEDVTQNVRKFKNVPTSLNSPWTGSVRGEAMLLKADFEQHFDSANPRNAANGTVRRSDGTKSEHLVFYAFDVGENGFDLHSEKLAFLKDLGFEVVKHWVASGVQAVLQHHQDTAELRDNLAYEIDGIVVRVNNTQKFQSMGERDNRPKAGVAYKFKAMEATTKLLAVELTIGHNGMIAPTAKVAPVQIGGVTVTSVFLNNWEEIGRLGIAINDEIKVIRAGDVIPKSVGCAQQAPDRVEITPPTSCPACDGPAVKDGANHFCKNVDCSGRVDARLKSWIKKRNIKFAGNSTRSRLIADGHTEPHNLYELPDSYWEDVPNGHNIKAEIDKSRQCSVSDFFGSLSIHFLGRRKAKKLVEAGFDTFEKFMNITYEQMVAVDAFGPTVARSIIDGLGVRAEVIQRLRAAGVEVAEQRIEQAPVSSNGKLNGHSYCFTGKIEVTDENGVRYTRDILHDLVQSSGGIVASKVTKDLSYLVQADPTSISSKSKKADKFGLEIISHEEFFRHIEGRKTNPFSTPIEEN